MTKEEFISVLKSENPSNELKETCLQYFVENYPVEIEHIVTTPIGKLRTGTKFWTALPDYKVKDDPIAMNKLEENFNKLVARIVEIENFK